MVPARPAFCALGRRTGKEAMTLPFAFRVLLAATLLVAAAEAGAACSSASDCQVAQPHCCAGRCVCDEGCSVENTADCTERGLCDDTNDIPRVCSGGDQDSVTPSLVCSPDCGPGGSRAGESCSSDGDCFFDGCTCQAPEKVTMVVSLPMTRAEFDDEKQQSFKEALAKAAGEGVRADHVLIDTIEEITAARRLLAQGIRVAASVNAPDKDAAAAIAASLTEAGINTELEKAGLPPAILLEAATLLEPAAVVTTANSGNQTASLLMSPGATVGGAMGASIVFTAVAAFVVRDLPQIRGNTAQILYLLDLLDTMCDWGSWAGTNLEGDFTFSNDKGKVVSGTLCAISIFGTVLFLISTISMWRFKRRFKRIIVLQLGFENFAQGILYIFVASSQASGSGNVHISVLIGIIQAICFCVVQIFELKSLGDDGDETAD